MFQNVPTAQVRECMYKIRNIIGLSFHSSSSNSSSSSIGNGGVRNIFSLHLWVMYRKYDRARLWEIFFFVRKTVVT